MKIGILGGGQLARMLLQKGLENGHEMHVLCSSTEPAAQVTRFHTPGNPNLVDDLKKFLKKVEILTFESEFIDISLLRSALNDLTLEKLPLPKIFPKLESMETLQDRKTQKLLLQKFKIPTLPFVDYETHSPESLIDLFDRFVVKKRLGGYDGYGTFIVRNKHDFLKLSTSPAGHIVEPLIFFQKELSLIAFRSTATSTQFLPLTESYQEDSKCLWAKGPFKVKSFFQKDLQKIQLKISKMLESIDYIGVIAFELFLISKKEKTKRKLESHLIVNEIAPRVHNTGHYSLTALSKDQFTLHLQAITGHQKPRTELYVKNYVMLNLIGQKNELANAPTQHQGALFWYGKSESRPGRKLGHINYASSQLSQDRLLKIATNDLKKWKAKQL